MKILPDNKILLAGHCFIATNVGTQQQDTSGFGFCAMRLMPDGSLDASFGGNSFTVLHPFVTTPFTYTMPLGTVYYDSNSNGSDGEGETGANAVDTVLSGDIILAGETATQRPEGGQINGSSAFLVQRIRKL